MLKDSKIFEFTNFILLIATIYSRGENKKKKLLEQFFKSTVYLLIFRQNSMIFKGSPDSMKESYFTGEIRLGES